jgi:signal transduction histidine kinase
MRRRLLISTLVVAVIAVLLLGVPLAIVMSRLVTTESHRELTHDADTAGIYIKYHHDPLDYAAVAGVLPSSDYVVIEHNGVRDWSHGPRPTHRENYGKASTDGYTVIVETSYSDTGAVVGALALVAGLSLVAIGVAVGLAFFQVRWFTRPLEELSGAASKLGSGDTWEVGRRYGLPELDQVAHGLDSSARRVSDLLTAEREFASDASHQLRTPLTALSMRLEEMIASADDPDAVRAEGEAALTQTERLADVVSQLLGRTRHVGTKAPTFLGVDDTLAQQVAEWEPAFRRANRKLELTGEKGLHGYATTGTLAQVVATLLDNALTHGGGTVTIRTSQTQKSVVVEVRDEGRGVPDTLVPRVFERNVSGRPHGTGLGLALARAMSASEGGRVVLVRPRPAVFAVFLPLAAPGQDSEHPVVSGPA